ncbi:MAG: WD40/YVTN/BNR-like repeat-containing protein [Rubrivivax sp.]
MATRKTAARAPAPTPATTLLVATRKGAWLFHSDKARRRWTVDGPHFLGHTISHVQADPRAPGTLLAAARTGHLGPTVFRSTNGGKSWAEAQRPPAFEKAADGSGRVVNHNFWLTPGHASQPGRWYVGTSPQGIFRSDDGGNTWEGLPGINSNPQYRAWMGAEQDGTPDGPKLHSLIVDPRDPQHLYFGMSSGGVHESLDGGATWQPLCEGLSVVEGFDASTLTFHDPHVLRLCPSQPDRLYQQNHCGIYRLDRPGRQWQRIGLKMPKKVGDIGFPLVVHPRDANTCWVFPMDGTDVWPRTAPGGQPAAYRTQNGGKTWQRLDAGLPTEQAWWTIKRQAMGIDSHDKPALYVGNSGGELWMGSNGGERWRCIARHLPEIYAVEAVTAA